MIERLSFLLACFDSTGDDRSNHHPNGERRDNQGEIKQSLFCSWLLLSSFQRLIHVLTIIA